MALRLTALASLAALFAGCALRPPPPPDDAGATLDRPAVTDGARDRSEVPDTPVTPADVTSPPDASVGLDRPMPIDGSCVSGTLCGSLCVFTSNDPQHCGRCGSACALAHATSSCSARTCQIVACEANFADCDLNAANGCEVDLRVNTAHCGRCGSPCTAPAGRAATCVAGACAVSMTCSPTTRPTAARSTSRRARLTAARAAGRACFRTPRRRARPGRAASGRARRASQTVT